MLHGDGVGELVEHPLLESLQPLVVMAAAHKLLVLQSGGGGRREEGGGREQRGVILASSGGERQLRPRPVTSPGGIESELLNVTSH